MARTWLTAIGLTCGLVGTLLIFRFGVPSYPPRSWAGQDFLIADGEHTDRAELTRVNRAVRWSNAGIGLLAFGFALQLVALLIWSVSYVRTPAEPRLLRPSGWHRKYSTEA